MRFLRPCALLPFLLAASALSAADNLILILDASGSMWGKAGAETKIEAARRVVRNLSGKLPPESKLGLVAYGHRQKGDCNDIQVLVSPGAADASAVADHVDGLNPLGMTPITKAFEQAAASAKAAGAPGTIVLVTDGLETCGGDPCAAVKAAKAAGTDFVLHVIGFDVATENVSSLECSAQAGGGLYIPAENADSLSAALEQTMTEDAPVGDATLAVKSVVDDKLHDAVVIVRAPGRQDVGGRTYESPDTNPRTFALEAGKYDIIVRPIGVKGAELRFDGVTLEAGKLVEKVADFSSGEIAVTVTRNGELSDATVSIRVPETNKQIAGGRTYRESKSNPAVFRVPPGSYDVHVRAIEFEGGVLEVFKGVEVQPGDRAERTLATESGVLKIGATAGGALIDATVNVRDAAGKAVGGKRLYPDPKTNPREIILAPGRYTARVQPIRRDLARKEVEIEVPARGETTQIVDFGP